MLAREQLLAAGHSEAPEAEAELHVINTCCITSEAESKSRQSVRRSLRTAREVFVAGCASNLNAGAVRRHRPARETVRRDGRRGRHGNGLRGRRLAGARAPAARAGGADARVREGAGRLRLELRLLHHPHRPWSRAVEAGVGRAGRGQTASRVRPAGDGDDGDQRRRLPRPRARPRARRADDRRRPGAGGRACAALERRGDPRQGHAARGARDRAEGLPAPTCSDAVRRRRRARRDGAATTRRPNTWIGSRRSGRWRRRSTSRPT